jgi:hypothetical protein
MLENLAAGGVYLDCKNKILEERVRLLLWNPWLGGALKWTGCFSPFSLPRLVRT